MTTPSSRLTSALSPRYALQRELGRGGMAAVYLAEDLKHRRRVAVKVLEPAFAEPLGAERFLREIEIAARLSHPHILDLHDSGEAGGLLYYVMPFVEGESLRARLSREGPLPLDETLRLAREVGEALDYAHSQGVVHRDIKPENILLSRGHAVVADFGIARAVTAAGGSTLTQAGVALGTPAYMSPEQASAEREVDGRSDIYSLGCVVFEMLAAEPPFTGPTAQAVIAKHLATPAPSIRSTLERTPGHVDAALRRALAKAPVDRFATAAEFVSALEGGGLRAEPATKTIAVLPFANLSADPHNEYFSDGLTDEIIADLSQLRALRVTSRTSAMRFKGTSKGLRAIARELNVRYVLEGSVRQAGGSLRITAQLIDAPSDAHLWAEKFSGTLRDVFDIQERVSRSIVQALRIRLTPEESQDLARRVLSDVRAYERYLRARYELVRWTADSARRALDYIHEAEAIVGDNVLLFAGMAQAYYTLSHTAGAEMGAHLKKVDECAGKILSLEPDSPHGHLFGALVQWKKSGGAREALWRLEGSADRNPGDHDTLFWLAFYAAECGQPDMAEPAVRRLREIDPLSPMPHLCDGWIHLMNGRPDLALAPLRRSVDLAPEGATFRFKYARALAEHGDLQEACSLIDRIMIDTPHDVFAWIGPFYRHALLGRKAEALQALSADVEAAARSDETCSWYIAEGFALIGETDSALLWLAHAADHGFLNYPLLAHRDPFLESVRGDPRFSRLMERVKAEWQSISPSPRSEGIPAS